ncbi:hypothetical protein [Amycolatopsis sp. DSM 110486]|uniref:hypothetical protein n=1 Tax=Amycolatopsis sp. DSM 110486 TaxID=2865832 RepID=UPI001C6A70B7|nr:hypothetical protein [Amycolatopsis sp. DSM 110486]QYN24804.1 hypothetical protein K1T34_21620 [Amycolatopsis sp. DSM 110486]
MSFDLAVWFAPAAMSAADAKRKYEQLFEIEPGEIRHPQVAAFYRELTARYPELVDALETGDLEKAPWSAALSRYEDAVVMPISWSFAGVVLRVVLDLARHHGLGVYNPQTDDVHNPAALSLTACDGSHLENPDPTAIRAALQRLSAANWYAILERGDSYVQVGQGKSAGAVGNLYALEHRDGSPDRHYRTDVLSLEDVTTAFLAFATHDTTWRAHFEWRKLDF